MCPLALKAEIEIRKQEFPKPVNCRLAVLDVRFGSKADMCAAKRHVCFPPNSDRESEIPQKAVSALPPKADMCGALAHVRFGPIADIGWVIRSPRRREAKWVPE